MFKLTQANELGLIMNETNARETMENLYPPAQPLLGEGDARIAEESDLLKLRESLILLKTIAGAGAASLFNHSCKGGDSYDNNCAHYLSDAFLRAGFTDLAVPAPCIKARCGTTSKRAIRARDIWCWFQQKQTDFRDKLPSKEGFWAVFQLNEAEYWGGHVVIIDTDNNIAYGTGHYPQWIQYCYKW